MSLTQLTFTCSKSAVERLEIVLRHWRRSGVSIVNSEHISHLFSSVSIADFEQVNISEERTKKIRGF